LDLFVVEMIK
jgi:hypothetical protein